MGRILYLYAQAYRAGSPHGRAAVQMLALLRAAGYEVDLLTLPGGDPWPAKLVDRLYHTARVPFVRSLPAYGNGLRRRWATCVMTLAALRLFITHRYSAVHCADRAIRIGGLVARLFGARFIFEWNAASGYDLIHWLQRRPRFFLRSINLILSDLPYPFTRLRETGLSGKIATLPLLPSPAITRRPTPPPRLHGAAQPFRLTALTPTENAEGLALLCDVLPELFAHQNLHLRIACGTPKMAERLRAGLLRRYPALSASLDIRPAPADANELLASISDADLVFLPLAHGELPPARLLDVMAAGRAILAIRCPAYTQLLTPANATLIPAEPKAFLDAIRHHMLSPTLCADHAIAAAETLAKDRSFTGAVAALRACYGFALTEERDDD